MKNHFKLFSVLWSILFLATIYMVGCVNYDQKTTLNSDGSGSMKIHYWTKMSNVTGGTLGKFDFDEAKAKENYSSPTTDVKSVKMEDKLDDSTKHVYVDLTFKDINKLSVIKGFSDIRASWTEGKDGMELKYTLLKDTSAANNMGASDYKVTYSFELPDEIISTNAPKKDGKTVSWEYKVSELGKDIDMTAVVKKSKGKTCGIFGFVAVFGLIGLAFYTQKNKNKA